MICALWSSVGCNEQWTTPERYEKGLIIVLPGIEGMGPLNLSICDGLYAGGVEGAIELTGWYGILGPLFNQRDEAGNRRTARKIAKRIVKYQDEHPGRPVILIGHSGGTAIATWTAEAMPDDHQVTGLILLASSLSAEYNLCPALERTTQGIVNFYSTRDTILLALGTGTLGTMDGRYSASAGRTGFDAPEVLGGSWAYEGLHNIAWTPRMQKLNHIGGHSGYSGHVFVEAVVAPLVREPAWSGDVVEFLIAEAVRDATPEIAVAVADETVDDVARVAVAAIEAASEIDSGQRPEALAAAEEPAMSPAENPDDVADAAIEAPADGEEPPFEVDPDALVIPAISEDALEAPDPDDS